jgi:hypothetical protein
MPQRQWTATAVSPWEVQSMRALLLSMLLLVTVLLVYSAVAEGEDGMRSQTNKAGASISDYIRGMSP